MVGTTATGHRFTVAEISSGSLPAVMKLGDFADGIGLNRRFAQRMAREGRIPATLTCGRYYVNTKQALADFGIINGGEA